ncbi:hypothetical protein ACJMK2_025693 [Sinanodonta woodiana]|uniref:Uncharacterized protein n=1 Tax=Sinanodonta woodiana TaxID=1069815 RepID=A0ABD3XL19_SINWO
MSPLPLLLVVSYLASYYVTVARTVRGIVGQNASLSFTFNNINRDIIHIKHNASEFVVVWPDTNTLIQKPDRVNVVIGNRTASNTTTVAISIMNLTENDSGMYSAVSRLNVTKILDRVVLETFGIDHFITNANTPIVETTAKKHYTTQKMRKKEDSDGIYKYITTAIDPSFDTEVVDFSKGVPIEIYLMCIFVGLGGVLVTAFFACCRYKERICVREVRESCVNSAINNDDANDGAHNVNQAGKYWTILSNAKGEMRTAIETDAELQRETQLLASIEIHTNGKSESSMRSDDIYVSEEIVGYLNPISSSTVEVNDYIHPIHSNPFSSDASREMSDFLDSNMNMTMKGELKSISI